MFRFLHLNDLCEGNRTLRGSAVGRRVKAMGRGSAVRESEGNWTLRGSTVGSSVKEMGRSAGRQ